MPLRDAEVERRRPRQRAPRAPARQPGHAAARFAARDRRRAGATAAPSAARSRCWSSAHRVSSTISPGGRPVCRSVSSACCRITTAAAWSTTARRSALAPPLAQHSLRGHRGQPLVDQPHRHRRHPARRARAAKARDLRRGRSLAAGQRPGQPDDHLHAPRLRDGSPGDPRRGRPCRGARSRPGVASNPDGSLRATPIRASPTSTPSRTPRPHPASRRPRRPRSRTSASASSTREASVPPPWATSSLPPPLPPTSGPRRRTSSLALEPALAGLVVDRATTDDLAVGDADDHHHPGPARGQPAADVERQPAHVAGAGAVGAVGDHADAADVRRRRPRARRPPRAAAARRTRSISFSAARSRSTMSSTRSGSSSGRDLERLGELGDQHVLAGQEPVGVGADQRLDPAYAGADRRLAEQLDHAELAGAAGVGAAAQLAGPVADRDHPHLVAVLLAEQRHRAGLRRASSWVITSACTSRSASTTSLTRASTSGSTDVRHRAGGGEVEPEPARGVLRAGLGGGLAERLAERLVHHVGRGVRAARSTGAARRRPAPAPRAPTVTSPASDRRLVHDQPGDRRLHVEDLDPGAVAELDHALVGELAAALGVERGAVEDQLDLVALAGRLRPRRRRRRCRGPAPR